MESIFKHLEEKTGKGKCIYCEKVLPINGFDDAATCSKFICMDCCDGKLDCLRCISELTEKLRKDDENA